jgi:hypothetical protein
MKTIQWSKKSSRLTVAGLLLVAGICGVSWTAHLAWADGTSASSGSVVRIEEDWCLLVNTPDSYRSSPQISTQMARAPYAKRFCNFHVNSCDVPVFQQGGLQLQVWLGNTNQIASTIHSEIMSSSNELVTWTQYLRSDGTSLYFGIGAASSTTWGDFSGQEVSLSGHSTYLDDYSSDYSVNNSGVTYGANRVTAMVLTGVRLYMSDGSVQTDSTPKVIYSNLLDPALSGGN